LTSAAEGVTDGAAAADAAVGEVEGEDAAHVEGDDAADEAAAATAATEATPRGAVSVDRTSSRMLVDGRRGWIAERRNRGLEEKRDQQEEMNLGGVQARRNTTSRRRGTRRVGPSVSASGHPSPPAGAGTPGHDRGGV